MKINNLMLLVISIGTLSCAVVKSSRLAFEHLSEDGRLVKLIDQQNDKCVFVDFIRDKLFIEPPHYFVTRKRMLELEKKNYNEMIDRLKNAAAALQANAIGKIVIDKNMSNWDRSKDVKAYAYKCN